jgi:RNA polymerase sigma-70 factor (ECF subfamily)
LALSGGASNPDPRCEPEQAALEAARDDPRAFETLYDAYFPRVYAYVRYRVTGQQDAEDIVAGVFLRAVEAMRGGRFEWRHAGSFAAWLFRIAHNAVADYHRHAAPQTASLPLDDPHLPGLQSAAPPPGDDLLRREQSAELHRLVASLSPRRQEVVTLKFYGGLRNSEIATVLGLNERSVASHLCRALDDLHRLYLASEIAEPEARDRQ